MPRVTKVRAIQILGTALSQIPGLTTTSTSSPRFVEWKNTTDRAIANILGEGSSQLLNFNAIRFHPGSSSFLGGKLTADYSGALNQGLREAEGLIRSMINEVKEFWDDDGTEIASAEQTKEAGTMKPSRVFLIHGRDHGTRDMVARFLEGLDLEVTILEEEPDKGRTVIEKFEQSTQGDFAIALLTPDDIGGPNKENLKPRARQNVVLEYGYYLGKFGRSRVCALVKGDVELPSDMSGVLYVPLDDNGGWKIRLANELSEAGFTIDGTKLLKG